MPSSLLRRSVNFSSSNVDYTDSERNDTVIFILERCYLPHVIIARWGRLTPSSHSHLGIDLRYQLTLQHLPRAAWVREMLKIISSPHHLHQLMVIPVVAFCSCPPSCEKVYVDRDQLQVRVGLVGGREGIVIDPPVMPVMPVVMITSWRTRKGRGGWTKRYLGLKGLLHVPLGPVERRSYRLSSAMNSYHDRW